MPAVNSPSSFPGPDADPTQAVRLLEMELARARAQRLARQGGSGGGRRTLLHGLCVLFLLLLLAAGAYAFWRAEELRGEARRAAPAVVSPFPEKRP